MVLIDLLEPVQGSRSPFGYKRVVTLLSKPSNRRFGEDETVSFVPPPSPFLLLLRREEPSRDLFGPALKTSNLRRRSDEDSIPSTPNLCLPPVSGVKFYLRWDGRKSSLY